MVDALKITLLLQVFKLDVCGKGKQILCSILWSLLYNAPSNIYLVRYFLCFGDANMYS